MKTPNESRPWYRRRLDSIVTRENPGTAARRITPFNSMPVIDNGPRQIEAGQEGAAGAAKDSHSVLHEARNTMTALLLTLEGLTSPRNQGPALEETIEVLKQLSGRLNNSIEKFSVLFSASNSTELQN
jgi:hypothetical protein